MPSLRFTIGNRVTWNGREGVVCGADNSRAGSENPSYSVRFYDDWNNPNYRYERDLEPAQLLAGSDGLHEVVMLSGQTWSYMVENGSVTWWSLPEAHNRYVYWASKNLPSGGKESQHVEEKWVTPHPSSW